MDTNSSESSKLESTRKLNESSKIDTNVEGILQKSINNCRTNILSVPSFTIEGFLRSAKLPEKEKEQLVKKYAAFLTSPEIGITEENQLSLLTEERLKKLKIPFGHAAAIAEASQSYGKGIY